MKTILLQFSLVFISTLFWNCTAPKSEEITTKTEQVQSQSDQFVGDFVSESYSKKGEGYDWVAVRITKDPEGKLFATVSSRADQKRPSCAWQSELEEENGIWEGEILDQKIKFSLQGDTLHLTTDSEAASNASYFYCNGGGSLKGDYFRLKEPIDEGQLLVFTSQAPLQLQGITFKIETSEPNPMTKVKVQTEGLEITNEPYEMDELGWYTKAEVEDLNSDGSPELVLFFNVYKDGMMQAFARGFSVNAKKSMSMIAMPELTESQLQGFHGEDELALVENVLVWRFPLYQKQGEEWTQTGKTRQIQYKLQEGEAMRRFVEDKTIEY